MTATYAQLLDETGRASGFGDLYAKGLPRTVYEVLRWTAQQHGDRAAWTFIDEGVSKTWRQVLDLVDRAAG
ncbi:MAG: hypothetical protein WC284_09475, partial [Candidimonas sp.]